jgi:hypothetical protein
VGGRREIPGGGPWISGKSKYGWFGAFPIKGDVLLTRRLTPQLAFSSTPLRVPPSELLSFLRPHRQHLECHVCPRSGISTSSNVRRFRGRTSRDTRGGSWISGRSKHGWFGAFSIKGDILLTRRLMPQLALSSTPLRVPPSELLSFLRPPCSGSRESGVSEPTPVI